MRSWAGRRSTPAQPAPVDTHELMRSSGWLRTALLGMSLDEASFARRKFRESDPRARQRLEDAGRTFLHGYHAALLDDRPDRLAARLAAIEVDIRGFAFEGAGMGLALLDALTPWRQDRLLSFIPGPGRAHVYMVHVGAGFAFARLPWVRHRLDRALARFDPLLRWLAVDGYGFHEGFFHWPRYAAGRPHPRGLSGYARRVFDQGLGRSIWFVEGADVDRIPGTIGAFPTGRHPDLWAGIGLACAYAGGVDRVDVERLRDAAGPHRGWVGQGAAFAAKARQRAGNPAPHTDVAAEVFCGTSAEVAAGLTDAALQDLGHDDGTPAYERWRRRIQARLAVEPVELSR